MQVALVERSNELVAATLTLMVSDHDFRGHRVVSCVPAGLKMDHIQPLATVTRETDRVVPDQVTISGSFRRIAQYLHGLESQPTLFTVERLQSKNESEQASEILKADLTFSIFAKRASFVGFSEKGDSLAQTQADDSLK